MSVLRLAKKRALRVQKKPKATATIGTPKLSIPKVDPNPQPPNAPKPTAPVANVTPAPQVPQVQTPDLTAALSSTAPINAQDYFKTSFTPAQGQTDPRDSTYWANLNKLLFSAQQDYQSNIAEGANANADYLVTQQNLANQRKSNERRIAEAMIRQGLSYSGTSDVSQADSLREDLATQSEAQLSKTRSDQAREAARAAILNGFSIDEAAAFSEAVVRQQEAAQRAAEEDAGTPADVTGGEDTGAPGGGKKKGKKGGPLPIGSAPKAGLKKKPRKPTPKSVTTAARPKKKR